MTFFERQAELPQPFPEATDKIVHHDDIALAQGWGEKVLDIGQETRAIHRTIKDTGRGDLMVAQGGDECRRHPAATRR